MAIAVKPLSTNDVIFGWQEIGGRWIVQARHIRLHTYGCRVYVDNTLEFEYPYAKSVPYTFEYVADCPVIWRVESTSRTWIDQPIKEIERSSVGGVVVHIDKEDALLADMAGPDFYPFVHEQFTVISASITNLVVAGPAPFVGVGVALLAAGRVEGQVACSTGEIPLVTVLLTDGIVTWGIRRYWPPGWSALNYFVANMPLAAVPAIRVDASGGNVVGDLHFHEGANIVSYQDAFIRE